MTFWTGLRRLIIWVGPFYGTAAVIFWLAVGDQTFLHIGAVAAFMVATAFLLGARSDNRVEAVRGDGGETEGGTGQVP